MDLNVIIWVRHVNDMTGPCERRTDCIWSKLGKLWHVRNQHLELRSFTNFECQTRDLDINSTCSEGCRNASVRGGNGSKMIHLQKMHAAAISRGEA